MLKAPATFFTNVTSIKKNFVIDKEGNKFLCVETGSIKCCTFIEKLKLD